jgi:hypothetical protein
MAKRKEKFLKVIVLMVLLVAFFQFIWPFIYNSPIIANLNPYPTREYLQIMWLFSPNGLSALTLIFGFVSLAWVAFTDP